MLQGKGARPNTLLIWECLFFRVVMEGCVGLLMCTIYPLPRECPSPLEFLINNLDELMTRHHWNHVFIACSLNHHMEWAAYESLLMVQGLAAFVTSPAHEGGGTLDSIISDLHEV